MKGNKFKSIIMLLIFIWLIEVSLIASVSPVLAQHEEISININDLNRVPQKYVNQKIVVKGKLRFIGRNYFRDPRFVIEDEAGNKVAVTIWAPLEVPPPMPGKEKPLKNRPMIMKDYVGRELSITGVYRADVIMGTAAIAPIKGFIEVESVVEDEEK